MSEAHHVETDWQTVRRFWFTDDASADELKEGRQLFYAGASCIFLLMMKRVILNPANGKKAIAAQCVFLESLKRELDEFRDSLSKGKESNDVRQ